MIEVTQSPERIVSIPQQCTNEFARITYTYDGETYTRELPRVGVRNGESYYYALNDLTLPIIVSFSGTEWVLYINIIKKTLITTSTTINGIWKNKEKLTDISVELVELPNDCLVVVLDGVEYELKEANIGDSNYYYYINESNTIEVIFQDTYWELIINGVTSIYHLLSTTDIPISTAWVYVSGGELEYVATQACECDLPLTYTSRWQAVHQPIRWKLQRKDRLVVEKTNDLLGFVTIELTTAAPAELTVGDRCTYYNGSVVISNPIINITGNVIKLGLSTPTGTLTGGFVIFPDLYSNFYIETSVLINGTDEIGTIRTIPLRDGTATVDVHKWLKTQARFPNEFNYTSQGATDLMQSGAYKLKFRECYNFTKQAYQTATAFYYWANSAKQLRDIYGTNMAEYVSNLAIEVPFLSVFQRPTNFLGFPFSLSWINGGDFTKLIRLNENNGTYTSLGSITSGTGQIRRLLVSSNCQTAQIEYGIPDFFGAFIKQGNLTESKQIKINNNCYINPLCVSWINTLGGREHWVFQYNQTHSLETSVSGTFEPIVDIETARGNVFDLEKFAQPKITVGATVDIEDIKGLQTLLYSICTEIYTDKGWINVSVEDGSFLIRNTNETTADIELTFILPYLYNQSR